MRGLHLVAADTLLGLAYLRMISHDPRAFFCALLRSFETVEIQARPGLRSFALFLRNHCAGEGLQKPEEVFRKKLRNCENLVIAGFHNNNQTTNNCARMLDLSPAVRSLCIMVVLVGGKRRAVRSK